MSKKKKTVRDEELINEFIFNTKALCLKVTLENDSTELNEEQYEYEGTISLIGLTEYGKTLETLTIPSTISIDRIEEDAFVDSNITSFTIPKSVNFIDPKALKKCQYLESICVEEGNQIYHTDENNTALIQDTKLLFLIPEAEIPSNITELGTEVFKDNTSITSITLPTSITIIQDYAFAGCTSLDSIELSKSLIIIGKNVFEDCSSLTSITIPDSVLNIDKCAFSGCSSLTSITLPTSLQSISESFLLNCSNIESVELPSSVYEINSDAFKGCSSLTSITIPSKVMFIKSGIFEGCSSLDHIEISSSVKEIYSNAFKGCTSLTSVSIPESVEEIKEGAFADCSSLETVILFKSTLVAESSFPSSTTIQYYDDIFDYDESDNTKIIGIKNKTLATVIIPKTVTKFGPEVFKDCNSLLTIQLPLVLIEIPNGLFDGCTSLSSITIPNSVQSIGSSAFANCSSLSSIEIPENVSVFNDNVFLNCSALCTITVNGTITAIGKNAFKNCQLLTDFNYLSNIDTKIEEGAFEGCSSITSITLSEKLIYIGARAFAGCSSLQKIKMSVNTQYDNTTFPSNVIFEYYEDDDIQEQYFIYAELQTTDNAEETDEIINSSTTFDHLTLIGLTEKGKQQERLRINRKVTKITSAIFENNTNIREVNIPNSVESLIPNMFYGCTNLESVILPTNEKFVKINNSLFSNCTSLESIKIPYCVKVISNSAFYGCTLLNEIEIAESVETIKENAFSNCTSLIEIEFPHSTLTIENAFSNCTSLKLIKLVNGATIDTSSLTPYEESESEESEYKGVKLEYYDIFIVSENLTTILGLTNSAIEKSIKNIVIPSKFSPLSFESDLMKSNIHLVARIENNAFEGCESIQSVKLPETIVSIGASAFAGCINLNNIYLPESLRQIESYAFENCISLSAIEIPEYVITLGDNAFSFCSSITSISIPPSITELANNLFEGCEKLTAIEFNENITSIGSEIFKGCSSLQSFEIPESVTSIGVGAFEDCSSLESINIPSSIINIPDRLFNGDSKLSLEIPETVETIGNKSFFGCELLNEIKISTNLKTIGSEAFCNCTLITHLEIPDSVESIDDRAFYGCIALETVLMYRSTSQGEDVFPENAYISYYDNIFEFEDDEHTILVKLLDTTLENVIIPKNVSVIKENAFKNCIEIKSILLPSNLTSIGDNAFDGCINLESITIPKSVSTIGNNVFSNCDSLVEIKVDEANTIFNSRDNCNAIIITESNSLIAGCKATVIPNYIITIKSGAFENCNELTSIVIPGDVKFIEDSAFSGCIELNQVTFSINLISIGENAFSNTGLTSVRLNKNTTIAENSFDETVEIIRYINPYDLFDFETDEETSTKIIVGLKDIAYEQTDIVVPEYVSAIGDSVFKDCILLQSISIPSSVKSFGNYAFENCTSLESFRLSETVEHLGIGIFKNCSSLSTVEINQSSSIKEIPYEAFFGTAISLIDIPSSVEIIKSLAFINCTNLEGVSLAVNTEVEENAFESKVIFDYKNDDFIFDSTNKHRIIGFKEQHKETIEIPEIVEEIGNCAFENCEAKYITIPYSVKSIESEAFKNCAIEQIDIPYNSITSFGTGVFLNCSNLISVDFPNSVTFIEEGTFKNCSSLNKVLIADTITEIRNEAFSGCSSLSAINLTESITSLLPNAFEGCAFKEIILPSSITSINSYVFKDCTSLENVSIPKSVKEIKSNAFENCINIPEVTVDYNAIVAEDAFYPSTVVKKYDIFNFSDKEKTHIKSFSTYGKSFNFSSLEFPSNVVGIDEAAFKGNNQLTSIVIPDNITELGNEAFADCINLETITIGTGLTKINSYTFKNCKKLTTINIPTSNVTELGSFAFQGCTSLTQWNIPNSVEKIGTSAFSDCSNLVSISLPVNENFAEIPNAAFYNCVKLGNVDIPSSVISIGKNAFYNCSKISSVSIPLSVKYINSGAFEDCVNLTSITIPNSVEVMESKAFSGCIKLSSFTFPSNSEFIIISSYLFSGCSNLLHIDIPETVTTIEICAFLNCKKLNLVTIPIGVKNIGAKAFEKCQIESVTISKYCNHEDAFDKSIQHIYFYEGGEEGQDDEDEPIIIVPPEKNIFDCPQIDLEEMNYKLKDYIIDCYNSSSSNGSYNFKDKVLFRDFIISDTKDTMLLIPSNTDSYTSTNKMFTVEMYEDTSKRSENLQRIKEYKFRAINDELTEITASKLSSASNFKFHGLYQNGKNEDYTTVAIFSTFDTGNSILTINSHEFNGIFDNENTISINLNEDLHYRTVQNIDKDTIKIAYSDKTFNVAFLTDVENDLCVQTFIGYKNMMSCNIDSEYDVLKEKREYGTAQYTEDNAKSRDDIDEFNSFDRFTQYLNIVSFSINDAYNKRFSIKRYNLNSDASYIPLYSGKSGEIKTWASPYYKDQKTISPELLGISFNKLDEYSESFEKGLYEDEDGHLTNVDPTTMLSSIARVYENYVKQDDYCRSYFNPVLRTVRNNCFEWNLEIPQNIVDDRSHYEIFMYNYTKGATVPLILCDLSAFKNGSLNYINVQTVADEYYKKNNWIRLFYENVVGTTDVFKYDTKEGAAKSETNSFYNIDGISASFNPPSRVINFKFEILDAEEQMIIDANSFIVMLHKKDLGEFEGYHFLYHHTDYPYPRINETEAAKISALHLNQYQDWGEFTGTTATDYLNPNKYTVPQLSAFSRGAYAFKINEEVDSNKYPLKLYEDMLMEMFRSTSRAYTDLSNVFELSNTYIIETYPAKNIANIIGEIELEIFDINSDSIKVYEDYIPQMYKVSKVEGEFLKYINIVSKNKAYSANDLNKIITDSNFTDSSKLSDIINYLGDEKDLCERSTGDLDVVDTIGSSLMYTVTEEDIKDFMKIYVNYSVNEADNGSKNITLYFNYNNFFTSPFKYRRKNGKFYTEFKPNTYLKLNPGENGLLEIVIQVQYLDSYGVVCSVKDIPVQTYRIWNVSDDKPKFVMHKLFTITKAFIDNVATKPVVSKKAYLKIDKNHIKTYKLADNDVLRDNYSVNRDIEVDCDVKIEPDEIAALTCNFIYEYTDPDIEFNPTASYGGKFTKLKNGLIRCISTRNQFPYMKLGFTLKKGASIDEDTAMKYIPIDACEFKAMDVDGTKYETFIEPGGISVDFSIEGFLPGNYLGKEFNKEKKPDIQHAHKGFILDNYDRLIKVYQDKLFEYSDYKPASDTSELREYDTIEVTIDEKPVAKKSKKRKSAKRKNIESTEESSTVSEKKPVCRKKKSVKSEKTDTEEK